MNENTLTSKYKPLLISAGLGSILGSGIIVSLAGTITVWQNVLNLSASQVGLISSLLTLSIAAGSLLAGKITRSLGLIRSFNILNVFFIIGTLLIMTAQNFWMLMAGTVIAGFFSGADLPVSLTMISHDAPNEKISAELVSGTQVYWTIGILLATLSAFATSTLPGAWSPRICTAIVTLVAVLAVWMRNGSAKIRDLHAQAPKREQPEDGEKVSVVKLLFGRQTKPYLGFFLCILIFYCGWNLLANTFGQFQTYMLVKANASQTFATGAGVILTIVCLVVAQIFSKIAGEHLRSVPDLYAGQSQCFPDLCHGRRCHSHDRLPGGCPDF
ncbi:MFS transporter, partial [uncultured Faecalibaculum sp.]|uniref:MFS transporter n=3 Tax=uncultured Faecalibaculum sp. TaxID=1729681 RepID=UPI0027122094